MYFDIPPHRLLRPYGTIDEAYAALKEKGLLGKVISDDISNLHSFAEQSNFLSDYLQVVRFFTTINRYPTSSPIKVTKGLFIPKTAFDKSRLRIHKSPITNEIVIEAPDLLIDYDDSINCLSRYLLDSFGSAFDRSLSTIYSGKSYREVELLETRLGPEGKSDFIAFNSLVGRWTATRSLDYDYTKHGWDLVKYHAFTIEIKEDKTAILGGGEGDAIETGCAKYDQWTHFIWYNNLIISEIKSLKHQELEVHYYHHGSPSHTVVPLDEPKTLLFKRW